MDCNENGRLHFGVTRGFRILSIMAVLASVATSGISCWPAMVDHASRGLVPSNAQIGPEVKAGPPKVPVPGWPYVQYTLNMCNNDLLYGDNLSASCSYYAPLGMAYDSGKGEIFVANQPFGNVTIINDTTNTIVANVTVGGEPYYLVYDSAKSEIFVANYGSNNVSVIADSNNTVVASVNVGTNPEAVAYDSTKGEIFVANDGSNNVSVIADSNNTVVANVNVGLDPDAATFDSADGEIFVANSGTNNLSVILDSNDSVVANINVGSSPTDVIYDSGRGEVFVSNDGSDNLSVISVSTNTVTTTIPLQAPPEVAAYDNATGYVFVACTSNYAWFNVTVINDTSNEVVVSLQTEYNALGIAYDAGNGDVYASNYGMGTISIIRESGSTPGPYIDSFGASSNPVVMPRTTYLNVTASGGTGAYTYSFTGLPIGCFSANTSSLICQPASTGNYTVWAVVFDSIGQSNDVNISLMVTAPPVPVISSFTAYPDPTIVNEVTFLNVSAYGGYGWLTYTFTGLPSSCGSSDVVSLICTPDTSGTYYVRVFANDTADNSASAVVPLVVEDVTLTSVAVVPATVTIPTGGTQTFTASPTCTASCPSSSIAYSWQLNGAAGTINTTYGSSVLYTAGTGTGNSRLSVNASFSSVTTGSTALITIVASTLTKVLVDPRAPSVTFGGTQDFTATPTCSAVCPSGITYSWALTSHALGYLSGTDTSVNFTAGTTSGTVGIFVNATLNGVTKRSSTVITVSSPVLNSVGVSPNPTVVGADSTTPFTAIPTCGGICPPGISYVWRVTNGTMGSLNDTTGSPVTFIAGNYGGTLGLFVNATLDGVTKSGSAEITVVSSGPTLTSVSLVPVMPTVGSNGSVPFTVTPTCDITCPTTGITYSWRLTSSALGLLTGSNNTVTFNAGTLAGTVGVYVNATLNGATIEASTVITVTSSAPTLASLSISPNSATIATSDSINFVATPACVPTCPSSGIAYNWQLSRYLLGSLSGSGPSMTFYSGTSTGEVGIFVNATLNGATRESSAEITVASFNPVLLSVSIVPADISLDVDSQRSFAAVPECSATCPATIAYAWALSNTAMGSISGSGSSVLFTAGASLGVVGILVNATLDEVTQENATSISIIQSSAPVLSSVSIYPGSATLSGGESQIFVAVTICSNDGLTVNCPSTGVSYTWALNNTLGTISTATGSYTILTAANETSPGLVGIYASASLNGIVKRAVETILIIPPENTSGSGSQTLLGLPVAEAYAVFTGIGVAAVLAIIVILFYLRHGTKREPVRPYYAPPRDESDDRRPTPPRPPYLPPVT